MNAKQAHILIVVLASLAWAANVSADLVARWNFNNNSNDQIGTVNWTVNGATYSTDRKEGDYSLQFDGVDDYATLPSGTAISAPFVARTVLLWFKPNSLAGLQVIYEDGGILNGLAIRIKDGSLEAVIRGNPNVFTVSTPLGNTNWSHAAVSFDKGSFNLYLNGASAGSVVAGFTQVPIRPDAPGLGARNSGDAFGDSGRGGYFGGLIDDVQVHNEALSGAAIAEITAAGLPKARKPSPANGAAGVTLPLLQWTAGDDAQWHNLYLGLSANLGLADLVAPRLIAPTYVADLTPGTTYWWRVDEIKLDGTVFTGDVWSFTYASKKASQPVPSDGQPYTNLNLTLTWKAGLAGSYHDVYFGSDRAAVAAGTAGTFKGNQGATSYVTGPLQANATYYWRIDEVNATGGKEKGDVWTFKTLGSIPITDPNLVGWWTFDEGKGARAVDWSGHGHHAELNGTASPAWVEGYDGGALSFSGTSSHDYLVTSYPGVTGTHSRSVTAWIKTATSGEVISWGQNASGQRWILDVQESNGNLGAIRVDISGGYRVGWTDLRNNEWHHVAAVLADDGTPAATEIKLYVDGLEENSSAQADGTINTANTGVVRIGESPWNNKPFTGLIDDVRIYDKAITPSEIEATLRVDPSRPWRPNPATGALVDIRTATPLTWTPGNNASKYDVYFGIDRAAVAAGTAADTTGVYRGRLSTTSFTLAENLDWGRRYFWRVDGISSNGAAAIGAVWSFTVADYLLGDDFESYTDTDGNRIYQTWIDGWTNGTGSVVGNLTSPFAEQTIVHGGRQSLPLDYDNSKSPWYSEAQRTWSTAQNWTSGGADTLVVSFRGRAPAFLEDAGTITLGGAGKGITGTADEFRYAYKQLTGDGSIIARVAGITSTNASARAGVIIRGSLEPSARYAGVLVTSGGSVLFQRRSSDAGSTTTTTQAGAAAPRWVKLTRSGNTLTAQHSQDGVTWTDVTSTSGTSSDTVVLAGTLYVGLAVSSHVSGVAATAAFSSVTTTSNVTGSWQVAEVGVSQPANSPAPLYLVVEDGAGKSVVVTNPDASASLTTTWTQWAIPLSSLTGVNSASVKKLSFGVGDRKKPVAGGTGRIYIDDLRITRGAPAQPGTTP